LHAINPALIVVGAVVIIALLLFLIATVVRARRRQAPAAREEVPITSLPKTSLGRWSLGLAISFVVVFVVAAGPFREQWGLGENEELVNPVLTVVLAIIIVGISGAALVTGLVGMIKRKERSVLVFLGMLFTFWWGLLGMVGAFLI
jgi:hydrogenase-4 membrane subunit HyfE